MVVPSFAICFFILVTLAPLANSQPTELSATETGNAGGDVLESLGSYERAATLAALSKRGLTLEAAPGGKTVSRIQVVNIPVFGAEEGFLRYFNFLHITTREHVIEREILLRPGEVWDQSLVDESQRKLKDPLFTSLVVLIPVKSKMPGMVDLLVVTRDVWSLRMNSSFAYLQNTLTGLQLALAENNILGLRKHGSLVFLMGQGSYSIGPQYLDKAVGGTRLQFRTRASGIFSRASNEFEGTNSLTKLDYPLWSLKQKWGTGASFEHQQSVARFFRGIEIEKYDNPATEEVENIDRTYNFKQYVLGTYVVRSFGSGVKQRVTLGHSLFVQRPEVVDDFSGTPEQQIAFENDVLPRSERASSLSLQYSMFTPNYVVYRNLGSFDLAEDVRLGPEVTVSGSQSLRIIGSEQNYSRASIGAAYTLDIADDGFFRVSTGASTRYQNSEFIDNVWTSTLKVATPKIANSMRLVAQAHLGIQVRDRSNSRFSLGGESGLRGYQIAEFAGQKRILTNLEVRSMPLKVLFTRVGGLAFWDMGHVADRLGQLKLKHGIGFGIRTLIPQLQPIVFRIDWALPLQGPAAGFPGRVSAGVAQTF